MKQYYSEEIRKILNTKERLRIAKQLYAVLQDYLGSTKNLMCLDVGCSSGVISNYMADNFKELIGIDIDRNALKIAKKDFRRRNLKFLEMSGEDVNFKSNLFDVIICNQVYNFVENPKKLFKEIYRVLKPSGICIMSARNKYSLIEPQYNLPLLSWLSEGLAESYIRFFNRGDKYFGKRYMSYFELKNSLNDFYITDYTLRILRNPDKFHFERLQRYKLISKIFPVGILLPLIPNYIWILEKRVN